MFPYSKKVEASFWDDPDCSSMCCPPVTQLKVTSDIHRHFCKRSSSSYRLESETSKLVERIPTSTGFVGSYFHHIQLMCGCTAEISEHHRNRCLLMFSTRRGTANRNQLLIVSPEWQNLTNMWRIWGFAERKWSFVTRPMFLSIVDQVIFELHAYTWTSDERSMLLQSRWDCRFQEKSSFLVNRKPVSVWLSRNLPPTLCTECKDFVTDMKWPWPTV